LPRKLGIGITYFEELEDLLDKYPNIVDILEIEPQTFWLHNKKKSYLIEKKFFKLFRKAYPKIVHSVGCPVACSKLNSDQIPLLQQVVSLLKPKWISEHLSFNYFSAKSFDTWTNFMLPPLQNKASVAIYSEQIRNFRDNFHVNFAIENGVNYLKPRHDEMNDGEFLAAVISNSDCGLVLDIHNAWCNEKNGRQSLAKFLSKIPTESVWEIHVAGGLEENGYWLDAHSGGIPKPIVKLLEKILPNFPNLGTIILEIDPSYFPFLNNEFIRAQLNILHKLKVVQNRVRRTKPKELRNSYTSFLESDYNISSVLEWERTLGLLVLGKNVRSKLGKLLLKDNGISVYRKLIVSNRLAAIAYTLRFTARLLMLVLGLKKFKALKT